MNLNQRLTRELDLHFERKANATRFKKYKKKWKIKQRQKERQKRITKLVNEGAGMSVIEAMFVEDYGRNIKSMSGKKNYLLDRINRNNFTGASISFPLV